LKSIQEYFPNLNSFQKDQFESLFGVYNDWNSRINVISRKDMEYFYIRHVLHSLSIGKFISLKKNSKILDVGTGGGFPGVPLAILFPEVNFYLVDSIGKKIKVINSVKDNLQLDNITTNHNRIEDLDIKVDFVVCRAVAPLETLIYWSGNKVSAKHLNSIKNGFLCLKGGDLSEELKGYKRSQVIPLKNYFKEEFFETKKLVYYPMC
tara:strand:+ start:13089 stop:13709 length:621 start_codon:yes stop_codon:yes gene_type:complete